MNYRMVARASDGTPVYVNERGEVGTFEGMGGLSGGFFKKLGKFAKKGLKTLTKVAPLTAGFIPGGSAAGGIISAVSKSSGGKRRSRVRTSGTRRSRVRVMTDSGSSGGSALVRSIRNRRGTTVRRASGGGASSSLTVSDVASRGRDILDILLNPGGSGGGGGGYEVDPGTGTPGQTRANGGGGAGGIAGVSSQTLLLGGVALLGVALLAGRRR